MRFQLTADERASVDTVIETLANQEYQLGPESRMAGVWRDWMGFLEEIAPLPEPESA
jgi:hypothetical protein